MNGEMERIRNALQFVPANDRDIWLRMGMAVKAGLGDAGFEIWEAWSEQDDSFDAKAARDVWKSIHTNGKVTIATLFHEAKKHGWRDNETHAKPDAKVIEQRRRLATERAQEEQAIRASKQAQAAQTARQLWNASSIAGEDHPYLRRKQVQPTETLREIDATEAAAILGYVPKSSGEPLKGRVLVVPVKVDNSLSTLELIDEAGRKSALAGGAKAGGYWATGPLPEGDGKDWTLLIGEGVATVLSASHATGHAALAALSNGNLRPVAEAMRQRYPAAELVLLADLVKTTGTPDLHALEAATSLGRRLAIPNFGASREEGEKDFNDLANRCGIDEVATAIREAVIPARDTAHSNANEPLEGHYLCEVTIVRGCDIQPEPIDWLWQGWIAAGKLHILGGAPGTGKTTIALALAATLTTGGRWPDGSQAPVGNIVIWSGEDDAADTLVPRLKLAGADMSRVFFVRGVLENNQPRSFDPARDMEPLRRQLVAVGDVRLLVVDPIVSAIAGDSHKNAEVRRGLQPLADLAASMGCALLGITHFTKGTGGRDPVERITGSLAFGALARIVLVAAKHQTEGDDGRTVRLLARAKSNIGPDDGGFEYDLQQSELKEHPGIFASSVLWGESVDGAARELLATADSTGDDGEGGILNDAKRFLAGLLADGPLPHKTIKADAEGAGFSLTTIRRAEKSLGVIHKKDGMKGGWQWHLPGQQIARALLNSAKVLSHTEDAQQIGVSAFGNPEHLRDDGSTVEVEI